MTDGRLKVLIADDDFRIGMLIKALIEWDELNLVCIDTVNNGADAFEIICREEPDIVITDIQMPRINGLDLIAMVKEKHKKIKFIVISGYKDFEYAHRALQYDVTSYLLKPIDDIELNVTLKKICNELTLEKDKKKKEEDFKKVISASERIIKKNILNDIIKSGKMPPLNDMQKKYELDLHSSTYRGVTIKLDYLDFEKINNKQDRITVDKAIDIAESFFNGVVKEVLISDNESLHIFCLLSFDSKQSKSVRNCINKMLIELQQYLMGFEQYKVTIGIGPETDESALIPFSIQEAGRAVANRMKTGTDRLIYSDATAAGAPDLAASLLSEFRDDYISAINSYSVDMLTSCINRIFSALAKTEDFDYLCYYDLAYELIVLFFEQTQMHSEEGKEYQQRLLALYQHCYTVHQLKDLLKQNLGECLIVYLEFLELRSKKPIREAKQYINAHKGEKIILEDIAEIVKLNPVYFSVLFKKETGLNFSAYLVKVRMDAAKDFLVKTNDTIAAIADKVGYKDVRHFSRLFAKTVGVNPAVYRKIYS